MSRIWSFVLLDPYTHNIIPKFQCDKIKVIEMSIPFRRHKVSHSSALPTISDRSVYIKSIDYIVSFSYFKNAGNI